MQAGSDTTKENGELEKKCDRHEDDARRYQQERIDAVRRKEDAERSVAPLMVDNATLKHKLQEWEKRAGELKTRGDNYKVTAEKLSAELQKEQQKRKNTETERDNAKEALTKARNDAKAAADEAKVREDNVVADVAAANKARDEAMGKLDGIRKERNAHAATIRRLEKQLDSVLQQDGQVWNVPVVAAPPFVSLSERRTPIISVLNLKGGVGKTTITANLAGYLAAELGKRVLLIDLDHQRSLTQLLLSTNDRKNAAIAGKTVQDFLLKPNRTGVDLHAVAEKVSGLELCSLVTNSDPEDGYGIDRNLDDVEMSLLSRWLVNLEEGEDVRFLLRAAVQSSEIAEAFDYVLIDCPPRLTTACLNALTASDFVLVPAQPETNSIRSVPHLMTRLKGLRDIGVLSHLRVLGIVGNMVSSSPQDKVVYEAKLLRQYDGLAEKIWGAPVRTFKSKLTDSASYASASRVLEANQPLKLAVSTGTIREQYEPLLKEIEGRINEVIGVTGVPS